MLATTTPVPFAAPRLRRSRTRRPCAALQQAPNAAAFTCDTALKEWASVCSSLSAGETSILLRKGGIHEKGFKVAAHRFALYSTAFHDAPAFLQPAAAAAHASAPGCTPGEDASLSLVGECTAAWQTDDARVLSALAAFHPWTEALLTTRLNWRPKDKLTVVEVRAYRLHGAPYALAGSPEHGGCKSWFSLPADKALRCAAAPVLSDDAWAARQAAVRDALATLSNVEPIPLPADS